MSPCPTPETLSRLACDSSSGSRFATLEAHVQMCAHCQEILEQLAADASDSGGRGSAPLAEPEHPPTIPGFVIEGVIGRGGMGVVYQAWQPQLARHVAIKIVSASVGIGAEDHRRWLREAQAIGRASQYQSAPATQPLGPRGNSSKLDVCTGAHAHPPSDAWAQVA